MAQHLLKRPANSGKSFIGFRTITASGLFWVAGCLPKDAERC
jgi:hypothetical protein